MRQTISNVLVGCGHLLHKRTILVLTLMFCLGVAGIFWQVSRVQSNLIDAIVLQDAALYARFGKLPGFPHEIARTDRYVR